MKPVAYGIDFGTTNSVLAAVFEDGSVEVPEGIGSSVRSLLYLNREKNRIAGEIAVKPYLTEAGRETRCRGCELVEWEDGEPLSDCRDARSSGHCLDSRLLSRVKAVLADDSFEGTHSWGQDFTVDDLVAEILSSMKLAADRHYGVDVQDVALGHPVRFEGASGTRFTTLQRLGQERLRRAAGRAGFGGTVTLAEESRAAVAQDAFEDGCVLCLDFGGGTFDVAVAEVFRNRANVLSVAGEAIGGEEFDSKIFDAVLAPKIGLHGDISELPAGVRRRLRSFWGIGELQRSHAFLSLNPNFKGPRGELLRTIYELIYGGQAWNMFAAISQAKHELSEATESSIRVSSRALSFDLPFSREEFDALIADDLQRVSRVIDYALEDAPVTVDQVTAVARTGGSSKIPAFQALIHAKFPNAVQIEMDPFSSVATGLAELAYTRRLS